MSLPRPSPSYDAGDQARTRDEIDRRLNEARARNADVEIAGKQRLILTDTVTGQRGAVTVASGVLVWTAL